MKKAKLLAFVMACLSMLGVLTMTANHSVQTVDAQTKEKYIIATDTTFAPFEFVNEDGDMVGIDMDLLAAIAEDQGFEYEVKALGFNAAVQALESKQVDGVIAGMSITPERQEAFDFSEAYYNSSLSFAVKTDSEIQTLSDLDGKRVAVKTGTQGAELADSLKDEYGFTVVTFEDSVNMYQDVIVGNSDAAVEDFPVMAYAINDGKLALRQLEETFDIGSYGFATSPGENPELVAAFNEGLANIQASGKYDEILATYLGEAVETSSDEADTALEHTKKYVIATDTTFAPFEFVNEDGDMVGIDMDLLAAIAEDQGFEYEVKALGFNAAVQALESKQVDGVIAGMSITPERQEAFDFSEAYYNSSLSFAVKTDSEIQTLSDLDGKRVAVKTGTQGAELADSLKDEYGFTVVTFEDSVNMYQDVIVGNSDAAVEDFPVMAYAINDGKLALRQLEETFDIGSYGFATSPDENPALVAAFNEGLANIQASGEYDEILATYLGEVAVSTTDADSEEVALEHTKKYVIATDTTFAPFEFVNEDGDMVGIDMDLLAAIAEDQGFEYEVKALGFNAAVQALESKQVDGVIAGMSITPERQEAFDFSEAYYNSSLSFAVKTDSEIQTLSDLAGKRVAVKTGTQGAELAESLKDEFGFTVVTFEDSVNMYQDVIVGNSDAAVEDFPVMAYAINDGNLDLRQLAETFDIGSYGFATSPGANPALVAAFNQGLANIQASGEYDEILATYLGDAAATQTETEDVAIEHTKEYIIATDQTYAPFEFVDDEGNLVGIDMDLMAAIAENQGFEYDMKVLGFNAAVQALESGQADGVIAGMSITEARQESFDFSEPYFDSELSFAVKPDSEIQTLEDLDGLRVAVKTGTQGADLAEKLKDEYNFEIAIFEDSANVIEDVLAGNSAALIEDFPVMAYTIKEGDVDLRLLDETFSVGSYGFAVLKDQNQDLLTAFNQGLANLQASGEYDEIISLYTATEDVVESTESEAETTSSRSTFIGQITSNWRPLMDGLWTTVWVTLVSIVIAMILGIALGIMSAGQNSILKFIALLYVDIMRGIPLLVLSFFIYFGIPQLTGLTFPATLAGIVTLSLNAAAYISEIVRGGIKAVPIGQSEASRSLGLPYNKTLRHIVLPQAFKIMVPSFINQFVITLKDTSILSVIGLVELTQTGKIIIARTYQSGSMWLIVGLMYIIIITALTKLSKRLEKEK
ncbi:ABC transporter substrate-binding protein/permease [Fundicoccus ignavus]|uniref:ABC transporter substrate-binding protein/permease n=1 Tax=Fundicoccus ignavus TaxID=2664442 RepID=UPI0021A9B234|nr:ABC transporter substrate-binding protein/permease [Fundicoccus ignavus]